MRKSMAGRSVLRNIITVVMSLSVVVLASGAFAFLAKKVWSPSDNEIPVKEIIVDTLTIDF